MNSERISLTSDNNKYIQIFREVLSCSKTENSLRMDYGEH